VRRAAKRKTLYFIMREIFEDVTVRRTLRVNHVLVNGANRRGNDMKKAVICTSAAMIGIFLVVAPARSQVAPQTVELAKVNVQKLAAGYRASKVIGSSVANDANETIGKIDDLLVSADGKEPFAVLSIGGFLGMGSHLVALPYDSLKFVDKKFVLPGGTKDSLKMLPEFKYASE
jgi:hypothetical protein